MLLSAVKAPDSTDVCKYAKPAGGGVELELEKAASLNLSDDMKQLVYYSPKLRTKYNFN